jgi:hypothetical protein
MPDVVRVPRFENLPSASFILNFDHSFPVYNAVFMTIAIGIAIPYARV